MAKKKMCNVKIEEIMMGSYEPTLADSIRIYKNYCINKGEISVILSEVYKWLAQEPLKIEYKDCELYARCECDVEEVLCVHAIYLSKQQNVAIEDKYSWGDAEITDFALKELMQQIKNSIEEEIITLDMYEVK